MFDYSSSDECLLQATGQGDLKAFEEIVNRHQSWAWRVACRYLNSQEDATDVVQEAFLRLLSASCNYEPRSAFRTYFYRIITRLCFDQSRKKQLINSNELPDIADSRKNAAELLAEKETNRAVQSAIETLPDRQRMAIILRYYEELSYQEIATILEVTSKAVERLLSRGRDQLRMTLGELKIFEI